jgi:histidine triad (HIT) family protein
MSCIFCQIVNGEKPARIYFEDADIIVFADIIPRAPIHLLFCPKAHHPMLQDIPEKLLSQLIERIKFTAKELGIENNYRLILNNGPLSGQIVGHLHFHFLSNANLELKLRTQSPK